MTILFLDFESYYDSEYSLRNMTPANYILDRRYETIGCAVKEGTQASTFLDPHQIGPWLAQYDPRKTTTVCFNALFDNCILAWQYGFVPARMLCTMRMAAALRGHLLPSVSLAKVGTCLGVGVKGTEIENMRGVHYQDVRNDPVRWRRFVDYANNDNEMNARIFDLLSPEFPASERRVMDLVLRCCIEPTFRVDVPMLRYHLKDLETEKFNALLLAKGVPEDKVDVVSAALTPAEREQVNGWASNLRSNGKFQELLEARGVDIEYKESATDPERKIPAFAKTDEFMAMLQEHDDPVVQALASARLGVRSTIEQSRGERILSIAELPWATLPDGNPRLYSGGTLPIPLRYSGAHTHRLSGDWKINMQNLPAGRGPRKSKLRKAVVAPPGYECVVADLAQIECRITAWLCGQLDLLEQFAKDLDPYSILASGIFGFKVDKKVHLIERFIGKSGVLGLGFGCGVPKFYNMVLRSARGMGMDVKKLLEVWTMPLCQKSVDIYRSKNSAIVNTWRTLDRLLEMQWCGRAPPAKWGPVEIGEGYVLLPNGMKMVYNVKCRDPNEGLTFVYSGKVHRMYGPKFLENIVQALARIILMNAALRLNDRGYRFRLQAHDELVFIVPASDVAKAKAVIHEEMTRPPSWGKDIPLGAEVGSGLSYGDAK